MTDSGTDRRRAFEDLAVGERFEIRPFEMKEADTIAFARDFDPQPFHLDHEAARHTLPGELSASGWHTAAMLMRHVHDSWLHGIRGEGSPGIDRLDWPAAVFPGDTLHGTGEILGMRQPRSRPHQGLIQISLRLTGRAGAEVLRSIWWVFVGRRERAGPQPESAPPRERDPAETPDRARAGTPDAECLWLETLPEGQCFYLGADQISAEEIKEFARRFDPQAFHLDESAAQHGPFGGLAASGWHSCGLWMRTHVRARTDILETLTGSERERAMTSAGLGLGMRNLAWTHPVRPDDRVHCFMTAVKKRESRSLPDWGIVRYRAEVTNDRGELVLRFYPSLMVRKKSH